MVYVTVVNELCEDGEIAYIFYVHRRTDGSPLPIGSVVQDNVLIFPSPVPGDSGDYICFSGNANFTYSLSIQDPPTTSPVTSPLPVDAGKLRRMWHSPSRLHDYCVCSYH